jgi:hypothetical protein
LIGHITILSSFSSEILTGLDLWGATVIKNGLKHGLDADVPWHNVHDLYGAIDSIQAGEVPWNMYPFSYSGPKPPSTPPQWMEEEYKLNTWDVLTVLEQQLATNKFDGHFETTRTRSSTHHVIEFIQTSCLDIGPIRKQYVFHLMEVLNS